MFMPVSSLKMPHPPVIKAEPLMILVIRPKQVYILWASLPCFVSTISSHKSVAVSRRSSGIGTNQEMCEPYLIAL